jgi:hypothetical protein
MACRLFDGMFIESLALVPEYDLYMLWTKNGTIPSRGIQIGQVALSSPSYYAYPPRLSLAERELRSNLLDLIDENSSGFYRYGSACVALTNVMLGKHHTFIGQNIRLWDGLAFLPLLASIGLKPSYSITDDSLNMVVSYKPELTETVSRLFARHTGTSLLQFDVVKPLEFA